MPYFTSTGPFLQADWYWFPRISFPYTGCVVFKWGSLFWSLWF